MASPKISHLILNTANYEAMKQWYLDVFEAKIGVETSDHSACFLQTDESHHRIGMFSVAKTDESAAMTSPGSGDASAPVPAEPLRVRVPDSGGTVRDV